jgi:hypothetical protein
MCCVCISGGPAQSAGAGELGGGLTAYRFEGTYKGESRLVPGDDGSCSPSRETAVAVRHGTLSLLWHDRQTFETTIADDGHFYAATESPVRAEKRMAIVPTLQGRISPAGLQADYGTRWCRYQLAASLPPAQQRLSEWVPTSGAQR